MGDYDDGWTQVRRGGRHRRDRQPFRSRQPFRDRDYGGGWMERAPPVSFRRRDQIPSPNRPVPPPRTSRYFGPQSRSFAEVVRQELRKPVRKFVPPQVGGSDHIKRQPAGPQFGLLIRKLHALIKMVHHLHNVAPKAGRQPPRMITKMTEILATMIRPAFPTGKTCDLVRGNAENWGYTTQLILQDHYEAGLETLLGELSGLLTGNWREPFQVAVRWARRNLPHVTQDVIDYVEALITARSNNDNPPVADTTDHMQGPRSTIATAATLTEGTSQRANQSSQSLHRSHDQDWQLAQSEPLEQRQDRGRRRRGTVLTEDLILELCEEGEESSLNPDRVEPPTERSILQDLEDLFGSPAVRDRGETVSIVSQGVQTTPEEERAGSRQQTIQAQVHHQAGDQDDVDWESSDEDEPSTPTQRRQTVTTHVNSDRKMIDWDLEVTKKWIIIGDSNLSRIPPFHIPDLQIDGYPGANFRHAEALIGKTTTTVMVEKVILSFGLNHRNQKARETSIKQLQGAVRAAKKKFPFADIWVPQLNFSSDLTTDEKQTLQVLNSHIERNMPGLPPLQESDFHTAQDNIHWTENTAGAMLEHWATLLNLIAP
ncbi:hypothetical protein F2P81_025655 [Scophthalmus maximus]|uniref:Uncharacterized protein n=1 Tax=Scophthalmus maximus TaxID=52904 RepID=A0A6A4RS87_SCOMX|nr:hypothetical protein F2P81_025655 [Scophthalmus maximus]